MSEARPTVGRMIIDCDTCTVRGVACTDCVVTFLTIPVGGGTAAVELDEAQSAAIDVLAGAGMVPPLRLVTPA